MNRILLWYLRLVLSKPILRAVDWTPEERNYFDHFCRTTCGIKLFEFLRQSTANATFSAVYQSKVSAVSANAHARGMQDMLAILHRLRVFPLQEESEYADLSNGEQPKPRPSEPWHGFIGGRGAIG
jgi:hypothetical protein